MLVYEGVKEEFLKSVEDDLIAEEIENTIYQKMNRRTAKNEFRSWENSLEYMYKVLNDKEIPDDAGIAIEYNLPQTSKRVDFIISGYGKEKDANVVIIELKQWDKIEVVDDRDGLVRTYTGNALREVVHPSYQAWSYASVISDYNENVQNQDISLAPCAYLHNYRRAEAYPIDDDRYSEYTREAPIFTRGQVAQLREFIKGFVNKGDNKQILYQVDGGKIKPSKSLQESIASMLKGNDEFLMLDEQKVVYETILNTSVKSQEDNKKRVIIVKGGPGTGKTVVAINLLAALTNKGQFCQYASKNSAPRDVYKVKLKGEVKRNNIDNMFKGTGAYTEAMSSIVDTILVDEAHRMNEKSGMFKNLGENQIKEVIHSAKCSVFFIDENQRVTLSDIGTVKEIEKWAKSEGAEVYYEELVSQFRCNGSNGYLSWIDNVLGINETANYDLKDIDYDIQVVDDANVVYDLVLEKNAHRNRARILAGYCWPWIKESRNDTNSYDIEVDGFQISWNLGNSSTYAIDNNSVHQAGCIHTTQGLEFDYVGVIIGDDLRVENGEIVTDFTKRAKTDQSLKGIKKLFKENPDLALKEADEIIKNTYRTLMTRGMKGCYIYCVDKELQQYLKSRL